MNKLQTNKSSANVDYGGYFTVSMLTRYRWWLILGSLLGTIIFAAVGLLSPKLYQSQAKLVMNLGGESKLTLPTSLLIGGPSGVISTEMQIINSARLANRVIDKHHLRVDIVDYQSPDSLKSKISSLLNPREIDKELLYNRIYIESFQAKPAFTEKYLLIVTPEGFVIKNKFRTVVKDGQFGTELSFDNIKITIDTNGQAKPGQRYLLDILSAEKARDKFRSRLSVAIPDEKANIVRVAFEHWNPYLAQQVLSDLIKEYIDYYKSTQTSNIDYLLKYTTNELKSTEEKLQSAIMQAQQYQELHNVVDPGVEGNAFVEQLSQLGVQKAQVDIDLNQMNYLYSRIKNNDPEVILNSVSLLSRDFPAEEGIVERLTSLSTERSRQLVTKTPEHPDVVRIDNQIKQLSTQLQGAIKSRIKQLQARKSEFEGLINEIKGKIKQLPAAIGDLTLIKSEIAMLQQVKALLATSQTETNLRLASIETNVRVLDEPNLPEVHHKPDLKRRTFLGLILGLFTAMFLMVINESYRKHFVDLLELVNFADSRLIGFCTKSMGTELDKIKNIHDLSITFNIDKDLQNHNDLILLAPIFSDVKLLLDSVNLICSGYHKRGIKVVLLNVYENSYFNSLKKYDNVSQINLKYNELETFKPSEEELSINTRFLLPLKAWLGDSEPAIAIKNTNTGIIVFDWYKHTRNDLAFLVSELGRKEILVYTLVTGVPNNLIKNNYVLKYLGLG